MSIIYWVSECLFKHCTELKKKNCYAWFYCFFMKYSCSVWFFPSLYSLSLSHSSLQLSGAVIASQSQNIKNPSEESSWTFPSLHGILASQFPLVLVTLRIEIPQVVFWKYSVFMNKKMVREFLPPNSFFLVFFFYLLK